jgi:hypothetical protein
MHSFISADRSSWGSISLGLFRMSCQTSSEVLPSFLAIAVAAFKIAFALLLMDSSFVLQEAKDTFSFCIFRQVHGIDNCWNTQPPCLDHWTDWTKDNCTLRCPVVKIRWLCVPTTTIPHTCCTETNGIQCFILLRVAKRALKSTLCMCDVSQSEVMRPTGRALFQHICKQTVTKLGPRPHHSIRTLHRMVSKLVSACDGTHCGVCAAKQVPCFNTGE